MCWDVRGQVIKAYHHVTSLDLGITYADTHKSQTCHRPSLMSSWPPRHCCVSNVSQYVTIYVMSTDTPPTFIMLWDMLDVGGAARTCLDPAAGPKTSYVPGHKTSKTLPGQQPFSQSNKVCPSKPAMRLYLIYLTWAMT